MTEDYEKLNSNSIMKKNTKILPMKNFRATLKISLSLR